MAIAVGAPPLVSLAARAAPPPEPPSASRLLAISASELPDVSVPAAPCPAPASRPSKGRPGSCWIYPTSEAACEPPGSSSASRDSGRFGSASTPDSCVWWWRARSPRPWPHCASSKNPMGFPWSWTRPRGGPSPRASAHPPLHLPGAPSKRRTRQPRACRRVSTSQRPRRARLCPIARLRTRSHRVPPGSTAWSWRLAATGTDCSCSPPRPWSTASKRWTRKPCACAYPGPSSTRPLPASSRPPWAVGLPGCGPSSARRALGPRSGSS
jgi:hypothetical protein